MPGRTQTNNRAELLAVLLAASRDPRRLEVRTDSEYVFNGARGLMAWRHSGWRGKNADLWNQLALILVARGVETVIFTKVKGHATARDIARGHVQHEDKIGNDGADALACAGADAHEVPAGVVAACRRVKSAAMRVQRMMVDILLARRAVSDESGAVVADGQGAAVDDVIELPFLCIPCDAG